MGHQLNFYLTQSDTELVERAMRKQGPLVVLHRRSKSAEPRKLDSLFYREDDHNWLYFNLLRLSDLDSLLLHHVEGAGYWTVNVREDPVVEFNRSFYDGKVIRRGRMYFVSSFFDGDGVSIGKDESFVKWARKIFSSVRKVLIKHGTDYIGPEAKELLDSSKVRLES